MHLQGEKNILANIAISQWEFFPREQNLSSKIRQPIFSELRNSAIELEKFLWRRRFEKETFRVEAQISESANRCYARSPYD
jgi:hypothetical protein